MGCRHNGYREIRSTYDADSGMLVYHWTCEQCSASLGEVARTAYRPVFDPSGNDEYLTGLSGGGDPPALPA
ncbi:MAG TPA: hypothetical protein VFQ12_11405 [Thermoleophilaceae bacterium]|nr:hypothetical protein [Thermoleophilaceae bacterium]